MNKTKLILLGAGILGSVAAAALSTGVAGDAVKSFCAAAVTPPAPAPVVVQPVPADAGTP